MNPKEVAQGPSHPSHMITPPWEWPSTARSSPLSSALARPTPWPLRLILTGGVPPPAAWRRACGGLSHLRFGAVPIRPLWNRLQMIRGQAPVTGQIMMATRKRGHQHRRQSTGHDRHHWTVAHYRMMSLLVMRRTLCHPRSCTTRKRLTAPSSVQNLPISPISIQPSS